MRPSKYTESARVLAYTLGSHFSPAHIDARKARGAPPDLWVR
jgi:hypothetical protein